MNKPPYELNNSIINLVAEITNKMGILEANLDKRKNLLLRKASKIRSVNSSCAIEANTLTTQEVEAIIDGKRVIAPPKDIIEIKNAYNAYSRIEEYEVFNIESFLHAHKLLMDNLTDDAGDFRAKDVAIYDGDVVVHVGARPQFVHQLMSDLFDWAGSSDLNSLIKACIVHYEIETIHPFSDGNGRIGRLWQSAILYDYNHLFELLPIETLVYENQQMYYDEIENSRNLDSSTPFIEFMLTMILKTIDSFQENNKISRIKDENLKGLSKTEIEILEKLINHFSEADSFTTEEASLVTGKSSANLRKYFRTLVNHKLLTAIGNNKGRKYKCTPKVF